MNSQTLSRYKNRVAISFRDFGFKTTILRLLQDALLFKQVMHRQYVITEMPFTNAVFPKPKNSNLSFLSISPDDKEILQQIEQLSGLGHEWVSEKLNNGGECVVAMDKDKLGGFNLASKGTAHLRYVDGYLHIPESDYYSEQTTVAPEYQRGGVGIDIKNFLMQRLADKGAKSLFGGYAAFNVKGREYSKKMGLINRQKVTMMRIFFWKKFFVKRLSDSSADLRVSKAP